VRAGAPGLTTRNPVTIEAWSAAELLLRNIGPIAAERGVIVELLPRDRVLLFSEPEEAADGAMF
jgi:hypothetical protein